MARYGAIPLFHDEAPARRRRRQGRTAMTLLLVSAIAAGLLIGSLVWLGHRERPITGKTITLYCAAGLRGPVEQVVRDYMQHYGVSVQVQYGASNTLLAQVEASRSGDLYLAGDDRYVLQAREKGLSHEIIPAVRMRLVIAVPRGNPRQIAGLDDLISGGFRIGLPNPDQTAAGDLLRDVLRTSGHWDKLSEQATRGGVFKPTVPDLANDVVLGSIDAGIVWDATVAQYPELEAVRCPQFEGAATTAALCVLNSATDPTAALHFARYLTAKDRGLPIFASMGYEVVEGDRWQEVPEITFFVGSVNRRAIEDTIKEFQLREGAVVNTVYNGCGILTAQMRSIREQSSGGFPDAYLACDVYYLNNVREWFQEAVHVSNTEIVLVVQKGNPKGIHSLEDLARPGVRVVVGQPEQCTIGALTRRLLQQEGVYEEVMANVVSQTASSAMIVPAVATGSVDVALAYATDAQAEVGRVDMIRIDSPYTLAIQPYAVARSSEHKHLVRRLFDAIARSRERFLAAGFNFRLNDSSIGACACLIELPQDAAAGRSNTDAAGANDSETAGASNGDGAAGASNGNRGSREGESGR